MRIDGPDGGAEAFEYVVEIGLVGVDWSIMGIAAVDFTEDKADVGMVTLKERVRGFQVFCCADEVGMVK